MGFFEEGFLSSDIEAWVKRHRDNNREWFALADDLNRLGMRQLMSLVLPGSDDRALTAMLLFARGLRSFEASLLMTQRGMTQEARILARSSLENVFWLAANRQDSTFVDAMVRDEVGRRQKTARALLRLPNEGGPLPERTQKNLRRFLDEIKAEDVDRDPLTVFAAAKLGGLQPVYETYYRDLSNTAAHPSLASLNFSLAVDGGGRIQGLHWGPDVKDVAAALIVSTTAAVYLTAEANFLEGFSEPLRIDVEAEWQVCWAAYQRLSERMDASPDVQGDSN